MGITDKQVMSRSFNFDLLRESCCEAYSGTSEHYALKRIVSLARIYSAMKLQIDRNRSNRGGSIGQKNFQRFSYIAVKRLHHVSIDLWNRANIRELRSIIWSGRMGVDSSTRMTRNLSPFRGFNFTPELNIQ